MSLTLYRKGINRKALRAMAKALTTCKAKHVQQLTRALAKRTPSGALPVIANDVAVDLLNLKGPAYRGFAAWCNTGELAAWLGLTEGACRYLLDAKAYDEGTFNGHSVAQRIEFFLKRNGDITRVGDENGDVACEPAVNDYILQLEGMHAEEWQSL